MSREPRKADRPARGISGMPAGGSAADRALGRRLLSGGAVSRAARRTGAIAAVCIRRTCRLRRLPRTTSICTKSHRACDDDFFYVGSAYWGIPWLEAILGCPVSVAAANCRAEALLASPDDFEGLSARSRGQCLARRTAAIHAGIDRLFRRAVFPSVPRCCAGRATRPPPCWAK